MRLLMVVVVVVGVLAPRLMPPTLFGAAQALLAHATRPCMLTHAQLPLAQTLCPPLRPPADALARGGGSRAGVPRHVVLRVFPYCIGPTELFQGLWDLDILQQVMSAMMDAR